ncbi:MAG: hypothetical protein QM723_24675 [Myxococcaceae bacterium]
MKTTARAQRGQATVETALGMLVFITVLMFGVYFGEISVMNMKVSEAGNAALWDISAEKVHDYSGILKSQDIGSKAGLDGALASRRYANFDGRTPAAWPSVAPNGGTFTGAFTQATGMSVQCGTGGGAYQAVWYFPLLLVFPDGDNGATCQAQAQAKMIRVPSTLADGTWSLGQHKNSSAFNGMQMCASGRPSFGGGCRNAGFGSLMDDFGYTTGGETGNCSLMPYNAPCPGNVGYYSAAMTVWLVNTFVPPGSQSGADKNMVQGIYGTTPWWPWFEPFLGPTAFGFSSCQEGSDFLCIDWAQTEIWASDGIGWSWVWNTTPFTVPFGTHLIAYIARDQCYLGRNCGVDEANYNP